MMSFWCWIISNFFRHEIATLTATSTPANYDTAVRKLIELREVAALSHEQASFARKLADFRVFRSRKPSLIKRLDKVGLT